MKSFTVIFTIMTIFWTAYGLQSWAIDIQPACPGKCVNEGSRPIYDRYCQTQGENKGKAGCLAAAKFGCVYSERQQIQQPGRCLNVGPNPLNDMECIQAGRDSGESLCEKYSSLGCLWFSPRLICR